MWVKGIKMAWHVSLKQGRLKLGLFYMFTLSSKARILPEDGLSL
jgi:hypothetical protein